MLAAYLLQRNATILSNPGSIPPAAKKAFFLEALVVDIFLLPAHSMHFRICMAGSILWSTESSSAVLSDFM